MSGVDCRVRKVAEHNEKRIGVSHHRDALAGEQATASPVLRLSLSAGAGIARCACSGNEVDELDRRIGGFAGLIHPR